MRVSALRPRFPAGILPPLRYPLAQIYAPIRRGLVSQSSACCVRLGNAQAISGVVCRMPFACSGPLALALASACPPGLHHAHAGAAEIHSDRPHAARDLLARAQTGTGKTAAFGLPMIDRLLVRGGAAAGPRKPRGLVLVPTRELALQVHKSLSTYGVPREPARHRHLRRRLDRAAEDRRCAAAPTSSSPRRAACSITCSSARSICRRSRS